MFLFIVFTSFSFSYSYYYNYSITYNSLTYVLWSFIEDANYLIAYSFWSLTFTISFILRVLYNNIFSIFYDIKRSSNSNNTTSNFDTKTYKPSKDLRSPIFISFLTNSNNNVNNTQILENLFKHEQASNSWSIFSKSFKDLYNTNFNLLNIKNSTSINHLHNNYSMKDLSLLDLNSYNSITHLVNTNTTNQSLTTTNSNNSWNLYSFSNEINKYNNLISGKKNLFYLNKLNFNLLNNMTTDNTELFPLSQALLDQTKVVKWNRWLYRYNVLHRKTVKNSHKLTMVKKLISTGFYDSSMMSNNIWASTFFF